MLGKKQGATFSLNSERHTHTDSEVCCRLKSPSSVSLFMSASSAAAVDKQGSPEGRKSRNGWRNFSLRLPVTVPVRLRDRKGSRLLFAVSRIHHTE